VAGETEVELSSISDTVVVVQTLVGPETNLVDSQTCTSVNLKQIIISWDLERLLMHLAKERAERLELGNVMAFNVFAVSGEVVELNTEDVVLVVLNLRIVVILYL
jgi:hypothetical protein